MLRSGQAIALCVLALLVFGVVMVQSAGMTVSSSKVVTAESLLLSKSTIFMGLALAAMLTTALLPIRRLIQPLVRPVAGPSDAGLGTHLVGLWPLWVGVFGLVGILALVYVPGLEREVNNSRRWVNLHIPGLDSFQPSELAKWALIPLTAWYCCRNSRYMPTFMRGLIPGLIAAGLVSAVIVKEDLGTGALVGMVACIMLIAGGARLWHLLALAPLPIAGIAMAIITNPYRVDRIMSFLNPYQDPQGKGYHMIQSMIAVANGLFFGRGLGHGLQKFDYLPEDTTDFIFAIICEEMGVFGAALVIFLYAIMLWSVMSVVRREPSRLLKLVGLGVMCTVGVQALINLAVVTGLGPTKGIALPLLSSGGTGWILTAASLGLVIAMDRTMVQAQADPDWDGHDGRVEPEPMAPSPLAAAPLGDERFAPPVPSIATFAQALLPSESPEVSGGVPPLAAHADLADEHPAANTTIDAMEWSAAEHLITMPEPTLPAAEQTFALTDTSEPPSPVANPTMDVAPGETGLLFAEPTPEIVVRADAKQWPNLPQLGLT